MELETRLRIMTRAQELFFKHGFSKVTMNEIASDLGMSKKTLYAHFESKEALFSAVHANIHDEVGRRVNAILSSTALDFVDKMLGLLELSAEFHRRITPEIIADIKRNASVMHLQQENLITTQLREVFETIIREGVEAKVIRDDINQRLLVMIHTASLQALTRPEALAELPLTMPQIIRDVGRVVFGGVLTEEGRERFRQKAATRQIPVDALLNDQWTSPE
jgi:AcrR family transcriptional regulator